MYHLSDLRLFIRAADTGNLSSAARQLGVTPAAASASVKRLEQTLDVRLFERSTRSLRLTPEGAVFRDYCERALGMLADGEIQARGGKQAVAGTVHLAAPADLSRTVLSPWLNEFQSAYPQLQLMLHVADTLHDLLRDSVDLAIRYGSLQDSRLVARQLCTSERVACAAPSYLSLHDEPRTPQDLEQHNCLTYFVNARRNDIWTFHADDKPISVKVSGTRSADDSSLARQWAVEGAGVVYKSNLDLACDIEQGRLRPLLRNYRGEPSPLHVVYLGSRYLPLRVRGLLDFLIEKFATIDPREKR